jgi:carbonic anhydrase
MSALPELLASNARYAEGFDLGELPSPPARRVAILTCMDSRLDPALFLGLAEGDAHVIRNAGGRASNDALRSLILSYKLLGTREFVVIHHTDCGLSAYDESEIRQRLERDTGADASGIDFLTFSDLEESVREDVRRIRESPFIPEEIPVHGLVYDVASGRLKRVEQTG